MIGDPRGSIEFDIAGEGPTIVLAPGSCSTGAGWRPIIASWNGRFRCATTSLLGYGRTAERRTGPDTDIGHEAEILETVIRRAGAPVHLVGHSFGGVAALAVTLRRRVALSSLTILEAPAIEILRTMGEEPHYQAIRTMTQAYFSTFRAGRPDAIATMIDFYGGAGTFASWPARVRDYAMATTPVNILDWQTAFSFELSLVVLQQVDVPTLVMWGGVSHAAMRRANQLLGQSIPGATTAEVGDAAHFLISTHPDTVGALVAGHVLRHCDGPAAIPESPAALSRRAGSGNRANPAHRPPG